MAFVLRNEVLDHIISQSIWTVIVAFCFIFRTSGGSGTCHQKKVTSSPIFNQSCDEIIPTKSVFSGLAGFKIIFFRNISWRGLAEMRRFVTSQW